MLEVTPTDELHFNTVKCVLNTVADFIESGDVAGLDEYLKNFEFCDLTLLLAAISASWPWRYKLRYRDRLVYHAAIYALDERPQDEAWRLIDARAGDK